jgi:hypothetical protein
MSRQVNQQMTPSYGVVRIHPSWVIEFPGMPLPDWRTTPKHGGWGESALQTIYDKALHRMMEASIRRGRYGSPLVVLPVSVLGMDFRILSGSFSPRRCIGCEAEGRERSLAWRLAGRLMRSGRFGIWCGG